MFSLKLFIIFWKTFEILSNFEKIWTKWMIWREVHDMIIEEFQGCLYLPLHLILNLILLMQCLPSDRGCLLLSLMFLHQMMYHLALPMCSSILSCLLVWSTSSYEYIYQDLDILTWNALVSCTHSIWWSFSPYPFFLYEVSWILSSLIHSFSSTCSFSSLRWKLIDHLHPSLHH